MTLDRNFKNKFKHKIKFLIIAITSLFTVCTVTKAFASYTPEDGRISYLAGVMVNTNFQETIFNNNDSPSKLGRSQSFAVFAQALGDINLRSSLMAEVGIGTHKFCKEKGTTLDQFILEGISFDLGYRHIIAGDFWWSAQIGSLYPWSTRQRISSQVHDYDESEFTSIYSFILGIQYESEINHHPVSYDLRVRKYMNSQIDDQMALGFSIGWRFM